MTSQSSCPPPAKTSAPQVITTIVEIRQAVHQARGRGQTVGLVPTMGALHEGHLSLVTASIHECDLTVATIFVNPTQFGPNEDLHRYPRTLDGDLRSLGRLGVDLVFMPSIDEMYPAGTSTSVHISGVAEPLEGVCRPGHFAGVATIVLKLFNCIPADIAYFGQKDYQQSLVIRRMVADLDLPIQIKVCPIIREPDGLALSSRNKYLSDVERQQALALSRSLQLAEALILGGERDAEVLLKAMRQEFSIVGIKQVDYIALVDPETLGPVKTITGTSLAVIAAYVGTTRLIDNRLIPPCDPSHISDSSPAE